MKHKKLTKLVCAAAVSATFLFGGCSPVAENENPAQVPNEAVEQPASQERLVSQVSAATPSKI